MPTLIVEFHCMCLFVPDKKNSSVHVLMPGMHAHGHGRAKAPEPHVVQLRHRSFAGQLHGRSMAGWSLVLDGTGPTDLDLNPAGMAVAEIPDLTPIYGNQTVNQSFVTSATPAGVAARVTLGAGKATERRTDPLLWELGNVKDRVLSNSVTWVIPGVKDDLNWVPIGNRGKPPIKKLSQLTPEADDIYRLDIHHETERTLPGQGGPLLSPSQMRKHFAAYYGLLGANPLPTPTSSNAHLFPHQPGGGGGSVHCKTAMAQLAP